MTDDGGRSFREAWISGVVRHFPGEPKPGYITPWEDTPEWERASCAAAVDVIRAFVTASAGATRRLSRQQRGQFVATCWIAQIHRHIPDPKPAYVAPWEDLPAWQRETDSDIFDHIEKTVLLTVDDGPGH